MSKPITKLRSILAGSKKGISDIAISMLPQIISFLTGFFSSVLIARGLGPSGMGLYSLVLSVPNALVNLSDLGIGQTAIRYASRAVALGDDEGQAKILRWAFRLRVILIGLFSIAVIAFLPILTGPIWHRPGISGLLALGLLISLSNVVAVVPTIYYQSIQKFATNSLVRIGQLLLSFCGVLVVALLNTWRVEYLVTITVATAFAAAFAFIMMVPQRCIFDRAELVSALRGGLRKLWTPPSLEKQGGAIDNTSVGRFTLYMMISSIVVSITLQLDVWLMGVFLDNSQLGIYNAALKFTLPLVVFLGALNTSLWPRVSGALTKERIADLLKKSALVSVLAFIVSVAYALTIPFLMPLIFGDRFKSGIFIGQLLSLRYCIALLFIPASVVGYALGMARHYWWINIVQFFIVFTINIVLLPRLGAVGAAIALICNELFGGLCTTALLIVRHMNVFRKETL